MFRPHNISQTHDAFCTQDDDTSVRCCVAKIFRAQRTYSHSEHPNMKPLKGVTLSYGTQRKWKSCSEYKADFEAHFGLDTQRAASLKVWFIFLKPLHGASYLCTKSSCPRTTALAPPYDPSKEFALLYSIQGRRGKILIHVYLCPGDLW